MEKVTYNIKLLKSNENENVYNVCIGIPISYGWIDDVHLIVEKGSVKLDYYLPYKDKIDGIAYFSSEVCLNTSAIYHYYFNCKIEGRNTYIKKNGIVDSNYPNLDEKLKISINFSVPDWAKGKIMYHIFVDRFNRGNNVAPKEMLRRHVYKSFDDAMNVGPDGEGIWNNDFYGGDLKGIVDMLPYIKNLGVSILYLSPVVTSQSNHRYDTGDYENVDPYLGNNDDLKLLCDKCHEMGIKVILDAVFNHTGNDSKYFNEFGTYNSDGAHNNKNSVYSDFYRKHEKDENITYDYWWGMRNLPVCDGESKHWQEYITGKGGIIDKWFYLGIDGLRLDVADELTDNFIELIRKAVKRNKNDGFILGEVWKNPMRMGRSYIDSGKGMDTVMNYSLVDALIRYFKYGDVTKLAYIIRDIKNEYPDDTIYSLMNFTSTHDISRAINIFSSYEFNEYSEWAWNLRNDSLDYCKNFNLTSDEIRKGLLMYKAYLYTLAYLPGNLSIFYGDEIGIQGMGNLMNRKPFNLKKVDEELLQFCQNIGKIRNQERYLEDADIEIRDINDRYFMFERVNKKDSVLTTISRSDNETNFKIPDDYNRGECIHTLRLSKPGVLAPYGAVVIKK